MAGRAGLGIILQGEHLTKSLKIHTNMEPSVLRDFIVRLRSVWSEVDVALDFYEMNCDLQFSSEILMKAYKLNFEPKSQLSLDLKKPVNYNVASRFIMFSYYYLGRQNCSIMSPEGEFHNFISKTAANSFNPALEEIVSRFFDDVVQLSDTPYNGLSD